MVQHHHRGRRAVRSDQHLDAGVAFAQEIGLDPVVVVGAPGSAVPSVRHPITPSGPRPATAIHLPGWMSMGPRSVTG